MALHYVRWSHGRGWGLGLPVRSIEALPRGFFQLRTREGSREGADGVSEIAEVFDYLAHVRGGVHGPTLCPFVAAVHDNDGYHLRLCRESPEQIDFRQVTDELRAEFKARSSHKTGRGGPVDPLALVVAFSHPRAQTPEFGASLETAQGLLRQSFIGDGLMLGAMHPFHADPKGGRQFVSAIPMLIVHRLHEREIVFMRTQENLRAYRTFFP